MADISFQGAGSGLCDEMQECFIYIQNHPDQKTAAEDLAGRMAYDPIQFSYLFDLFFEKSIEEWETEVVRAYPGFGRMPYERTAGRKWIDVCFIRRGTQRLTAYPVLDKQGDRNAVLETGMQKVEAYAREQWKKRIRTKEHMLFWWHDSEYRFHFLLGSQRSEEAGQETKAFEIKLEASDYAVFTWKENFADKPEEEMLKSILKYALCDWEKETQIDYDRNKIYFISYENGKYAVCMPLKKRMQENYKIKHEKQERKIYGLDEWIDYIDKHIEEELTAKNLAAAFGYSERHFRNVFQIYYDVKLNDYIRKRKLYFAAQELKNGNKPEKVARKYAFKSNARFSRAFHEEYGMTPAKYYKEEFQNEEWIRYIDQHITEELTMDDLAAEFHYSKDHFRKEFQEAFGMGPVTYITQRKVRLAAQKLREGKAIDEVGKAFGFHSRNGFDKAFRRVFYTSPAKYAKARPEVVNLNRYYAEYKNKIKVSYIIDMDEIKMAGWTIIPNRRETDIPAQLAFWLDEPLPQYRKLSALTGEEKGRDKIALWYKEKKNIEYILGPIVDSFDSIPEDAFQVTIAAGRYAVFESDQENDMENLPETVRMFARCVLYGWIREHRDILCLQRVSFERYTNQKMYLYVPISETESRNK